jgi:hypothetical protein
MRLIAVLLLLAVRPPSPISGTWELARIFRTGATAANRPVARDSTVFIRVTIESQPHGFILGTLERSYFGDAERSRVQGKATDAPGRWVVTYRVWKPTWERGETAFWMVGDTLRAGPAFVPGADSLELRRVSDDAPYPKTVLDVVRAR